MPQRRVKVTDLELLILQRIWESQKPLTVGAIVETWPGTKKPGYTTVLKTLQKMEAKGVVGHREDGKRYAYFAKTDREDVAESRLEQIIDRMFGGDRVSFVQYFIDSRDFDPDELRELKKLLSRKQQSRRR
jgi:BlaI family penicillinase repressor